MRLEAKSAGTWQAAFDSLRLADPARATALAERFPEFRTEILGRRVFGVEHGAEPDSRPALGRAALEAVLASVMQSLNEVLAVTRRRARLLARLRLGSSLAAALGSGGVLAGLLGNSGLRAAIAAVVAGAAALFNLLATYREEQSGGEGSLVRLRETLFEQVAAVAEIRGKLAFGLLAQEDGTLLESMAALNGISARLLTARAKLGLPLPTTLA